MPPSRALPRQGSLTDALLARDISCRFTATVEGTEHAPLVPRTQVDWFRRNTMFRYGVAPRPEIEPIDVPRNALLLRSDIHTVFDQRRFAITLKPLPVASDSAATAQRHTDWLYICFPPACPSSLPNSTMVSLCNPYMASRLSTCSHALPGLFLFTRLSFWSKASREPSTLYTMARRLIKRSTQTNACNFT